MNQERQLNVVVVHTVIKTNDTVDICVFIIAPNRKQIRASAVGVVLSVRM